MPRRRPALRTTHAFPSAADAFQLADVAARLRRGKVFREPAPSSLTPSVPDARHHGPHLPARQRHGGYGAQIFREDGQLRTHGNDGRLSPENLRAHGVAAKDHSAGAGR
ncbi:hypothetical protein SBA4_4580011 [Candidatus Sulfopaludibacter sp. SbA4]|nr:hypothetical protein SBA4_4580011 [Candidatus Sulfopaludibacter sp. SbA4]